MISAREGHEQVTLSSGKVLVVGGYNNTQETNLCEVYDPSLNNWTATGTAMASRRFHASATLRQDQTVLVAGGVDQNNMELAGTEIYTPSATFTKQFAIVQGNNQSATVNTPVLIQPIVRLQFTSGVECGPGFTVTYSVTQNNGSVTGATPQTDALSNAVLGSWTLGTASGANQLTVTAANSSSTTFSATGTAGAVKSMTVVAGDNQTATVNTAVAIAPKAQAKDMFGNPCPGVTVTFGVSTGGGSVTGATVVADVNGMATVGSWKLGTTAGSNSINAFSNGQLCFFNATATPGAPASLSVNGGNNQNAVVNTNVATAPSVLLTDSFGNPISGGGVSFAATAGGGSVTGGVTNTNASGVATVGSWKMGTVTGSDQLTATSGSLNCVINATATPGAATSININGGNNQTATVNTTVATPPSVKVVDQYGNGVGSNFGITFTVGANSGSVTGSFVLTDNNSVATVGSWKLDTLAGVNTLSADAPGFTSAVFNATGTAGPAASFTVVAGDNQMAIVNTNVAVAPAVKLLDAFNNPLVGVQVTYSVNSGNGSITGSPVNTDANGTATLGSWKLGTLAGMNQLQAVSSGFVAFVNAIGTPDAASQILKYSGDGQSAVVNTPVASPPAVQVVDAYGNPIAAYPVSFSVDPGNGGITGATSNTDPNGIASVGSWTLDTAVHTNMLKVDASGLTQVNFIATGVAGAPVNFTIGAGNNQSATVNTNVPVAPMVLVRDQFNNPVSNVALSFVVSAGGGSVTGASVQTDGSGFASVGSFTLGMIAGTNTLDVVYNSAVVVTATATGLPDVPAMILVAAGDNQTAPDLQPVAVAPSVQVKDQFGNNVAAGYAVNFSVASGGGSVTGGATATDANGIATVGSWTLGPAVSATNTLSATCGSAPAATFTATSYTVAPVFMALTTNDNPQLFGKLITYTISASDIDSPTLMFAVDFGDGSAPVSGSFTQGTSVNATHTYTTAGDYKVVASVSDGGFVVTKTAAQTILAPASTGAGLPNISDGIDTVKNPVTGVTIGVADSNGGVIELQIDVDTLVRANYDVTTEWGDIAGRGAVVKGTRPVHKYVQHGIFVATTTVNDADTGKPLGKGRKMLVISSRETGEKPPEINKEGKVVNTAPPSNRVNLSKFYGKVDFEGAQEDSVQMTAAVKMAAGVDLSQPIEFFIGVGNVVVATTIYPDGHADLPGTPGYLSNLHAYLPRVKRGQLTKGGETLRLTFGFLTKNLVGTGFDTEGIVKSPQFSRANSTVPRMIQIGMLINGESYESIEPVKVGLPTNPQFGIITGR